MNKFWGWVRSHLDIPNALPTRTQVPPPLLIGNSLEDEPAEGDKYARQLALPVPPKRAQPQMAMDDANSFGYNAQQGGWLNTIGGAGAFALYFPGYPLLAQLAQRSEFRQPVETTAKELTRKWIEFKSASKSSKAEKIKELEAAVKTFKLQAHIHKGCTHDGYYGMGPVHIKVRNQEGNAALEIPLTIEDGGSIKKGDLLAFINIEPMWATPLVWNAVDPLAASFYKPEHWNLIGRKVHHSRLFMFISREVPDIIKPAYNFGGISLTQLINPYVDRWLATVAAINRLINNFSIIKLASNLVGILAGGPAGALLKRLKFFTQRRDNQGVFLIDKAQEELDQVAVPLSGLSELQAQSQEHMAAPTHLPLVVLTGITPAGLNASSEGEIQVFHDWIHAVQESMIRPHLDKMIKAIMLHLWGSIDTEISYDFVPLKEVVGEAAARIVKMKADAGIAYVQNAVIDPLEERQRLANDPDSGYLNLNVEEVPKPPAVTAANLMPPEPGDDGGGANDQHPLGLDAQQRDAHGRWTREGISEELDTELEKELDYLIRGQPHRAENDPNLDKDALLSVANHPATKPKLRSEARRVLRQRFGLDESAQGWVG